MVETLSVCLITKDEERYLEKCLNSAYGHVDEVVIVDTGSRDRTIEIAQSFGVDPVGFPWCNDFASARNVALGLASSKWVLSLDADEWVVADWDALREALRAPTLKLAYLIDIDVKCAQSFGGDYSFFAPRLFKKEDLRWHNRVHEKLLTAQGNEPEWNKLEPSILKIVDVGYQNEEDCHAKAKRNYDLALFDLADSQNGSNSRDAKAQKLFEVGRSLVTLGRREESLQYFEDAREETENLTLWLQASDFLSRQLLSLRKFDLCIDVVTELRQRGGDARYCDWLSGQALAQSGHPNEALNLLIGLEKVVDTLGIEIDPKKISEFESLCLQMCELTNT